MGRTIEWEKVIRPASVAVHLAPRPYQDLHPKVHVGVAAPPVVRMFPVSPRVVFDLGRTIGETAVRMHEGRPTYMNRAQRRAHLARQGARTYPRRI